MLCHRRAALLILTFAVVSTCGIPCVTAQERRSLSPADLLTHAPERTWAFAAIDVPQVLGVQAVKQMQAGGMPLPPLVSEARAAAFYVTDVLRLREDKEPLLCGLVYLTPEGKKLVEADLRAEGDAGTVDGLETFSYGSLVATFAGEILLFASGESALSRLIQSHNSPGGTDANTQLEAHLGHCAGAAVQAAFALPAPWAQVWAEDEAAQMPPPMGGITGGSLAIRVTDPVSVEGRFILKDAADAEGLRQMAQTQIDMARQSMQAAVSGGSAEAMIISPMMGALAAVELSAEANEFVGTMEMTQMELSMLVSITLPAIHRARGEARKSASRHNLHNIGLGLFMVREARDGDFPADLSVLLKENYIDDKEILLDPSDNSPQPIEGTDLLCSYVYVGALPGDVPPQTILCYTRKGIYPEGRNVLYADCAVRFVRETDLQEPDGPPGDSLAASYGALIDALGDKITEERRAELKKFYEIAD
jgi:hypothetical protein